MSGPTSLHARSINHKHAPTEVREKAHLSEEQAVEEAIQRQTFAGEIAVTFSYDETGLLALLEGLELESAPGTRVRYSNLGAALAAIALSIKQEILLFLVGGLFVLEALSVILQVAYFRWRGGRRIFRMAPLHHHFELAGWSESKVVIRFWILAILFALFALEAANAVYLLGVRLAGWATGSSYEDRLYLVVFLGHLVLGLAMLALGAACAGSANSGEAGAKSPPPAAHDVRLVLQITVDVAVVLGDVGQKVLMVRANVVQQTVLEPLDVRDRHLVEIAVHAGEDDEDDLGVGAQAAAEQHRVLAQPGGVRALEGRFSAHAAEHGHAQALRVVVVGRHRHDVGVRVLCSDRYPFCAGEIGIWCEPEL